MMYIDSYGVCIHDNKISAVIVQGFSGLDVGSRIDIERWWAHHRCRISGCLVVMVPHQSGITSLYRKIQHGVHENVRLEEKEMRTMSEERMPQGFEDVSFADNRDPRCPLVLILDGSGSMFERYDGHESSADGLNRGLEAMVRALHKDPLAKRRVMTSIVVYGSEVATPTPFVDVEHLTLPILSPMGLTSTGQAITTALDSLEEYKGTLKSEGIDYYRAFVVLMSDGLSTDDVEEASRRVKEGDAQGKFKFFPVAVQDDEATVSEMSGIGNIPAMVLKEGCFDEFFQWLSASTASVSASQPGDRIKLPSPEGWADF